MWGKTKNRATARFAEEREIGRHARGRHVESADVRASQQAIGTLVLLGLAFLAVAYVGGYLWYWFLGYPWAKWHAKRERIVHLRGGECGGLVGIVRYASKDWRRATFNEWRRESSSARLWPTRQLSDDEFMGY